MKTAIILISEAGLSTANLLCDELPDTQVFSLYKEQGYALIESVDSFTAAHFHHYDAFIFIGTLDICVRAIAPCIKSQDTDPDVVCVDCAGRYAVSVISGQISGANELTSRISGILHAEPVITMQSGYAGLWTLDTFSKRFGWFPIINAEPSAFLMAELAKTKEEKIRACMNEHINLFAAGKPTALLLTVRDKGTDWMEANLPPHVEVFYRISDVDTSRFKLILCVSPKAPLFPSDLPMICYVPPVVHVGINLPRQVGTARKVQDALFNDLYDLGYIRPSIASISTIDSKKDEQVMKAFKKKFSVHYYAAEQLAQVDVPHPSKMKMKQLSTPSVSEAAAMLTSGNSLLAISKEKGEGCTFAAAIDINASRRGHIEIVGAGPGHADLISVRGRRMLEKADLILYDGTLVSKEMIQCAKPGSAVHNAASMSLKQQLAMMKECYDKNQFIVSLHGGAPCISDTIEKQISYFDQCKMSYHIVPGISQNHPHC